MNQVFKGDIKMNLNDIDEIIRVLNDNILEQLDDDTYYSVPVFFELRTNGDDVLIEFLGITIFNNDQDDYDDLDDLYITLREQSNDILSVFSEIKL
jgi:hypothetical protein